MKGIIMSGDHPKLILEGIKTMSRRVIKPQPYQGTYDARMIDAVSPSGKAIAVFHSPTEKGFIATPRHCPYGQVGDRLWVRETYTIQGGDFPLYKADCSTEFAKEFKWFPSIFMPRWASRITLEITDIRVERLQEISREDIGAEGCTWERGDGPWDDVDNARRWFSDLWDSLNAKRGYGWEANPFVWCISFKVVK